jgi:hypothetical protein
MKRRKCILLLPLAFNDGVEVPPTTLAGILRDIEETFDGYNVAGTCDGSYRMDNGELVHDKSLMVWVVVDAERVDELRQQARRIAGILKQESLYFEVTEAEPEFVRPLSESGEAQ